MLKPILHDKTDILFIPLNPGEESSRLGHYFAANDVFWKSIQIAGFFKSGICLSEYTNGKGKKDYKVLIDDNYADEVVFRTNKKNYNSFFFGVHDLAHDIVDSKSTNVKVTSQHINHMRNQLKKLNPKFAIIMSREVKDKLMVPMRERWNSEFNRDEYNRWSVARKDFRKIKEKMKEDWGPWGRVINDLDTYFFCIPFPSTQFGSRNQHFDFWCTAFQHIKALND